MSSKDKTGKSHSGAKGNTSTSTADEGQGQAGHFGTDGESGTHKGPSPDRTSPAVSKNDTGEKERKS